MTQHTDVLIVGAGPIGLINAWALKRLNPKLNIVILEKYSEYQRKHTLVMQPEHLEAIMRAAHAENEPALVNLVTQLRKEPHIRTNTLQTLLTQLATDSGVEIQTKKEVLPDTLNELIKNEFPNVRFIIGADGTHSVVSKTLYPEGNQVKYEYDYVLQLRFDIKGDMKAPGENTARFLQQMTNRGLVGQEYIGSFEAGKTPVTMQIMISKKDFITLKDATSKDPIKPYAANSNQAEKPELPAHINSFVSTYLNYKIQDTTAVAQTIDKESVTVSVNEAPATHAKKVFTQCGQARVVLEGDAALGLSYFKGLNAGLEATAKFLTKIESSVNNSFADKAVLDKQLEAYQEWFLSEFSPKKVKEVGRYSFWRIRSLMSLMQGVRYTKQSSFHIDEVNFEPAIRNYFNHYLNETPAPKNREWHPYPHREYDLVEIGQLNYVPIKHTFKKIGKIFIDFFKPYKDRNQILQDFKQPLTGIAHLFGSIAKFFLGLYQRNGYLLLDSFFNLVRAGVELITTPLVWLIKPLTRTIATLIHGGFKKIEENEGINQLADLGKQRAQEHDQSSHQQMHELMAICNDIHRKFDKALSRGQKTELELQEYALYSQIQSDALVNREKLKDYFSLFTAQRKEISQTANLTPVNRF